ncbi:hypothetical protein M316_0053 [Nitrincola phage 1M3-16]|uniref:hypothetical protein n=1 Tax=Nitrincola phage 1M3-16 TaxID=1472912 RepID=UPI000444CD2C|nr:hypothetical protein GJ22_gp099 [Nitrincola phage 1M3-16]AHX01118.1 hypothetical protein M316_0053 [Nitrincola phage 1M3-16]
MSFHNDNFIEYSLQTLYQELHERGLQEDPKVVAYKKSLLEFVDTRMGRDVELTLISAMTFHDLSRGEL